MFVNCSFPALLHLDCGRYNNVFYMYNQGVRRNFVHVVIQPPSMNHVHTLNFNISY